MSKSIFRAETLESRNLFSAGLPDATFNLTGKQSVGFDQQFDTGSAVALQSDGKIILAGATSSNSNGLNSFALARLNADGSLDTTFDTDGRVVTTFPGGRSAQPVGLGIVGDKILVGGLAVDPVSGNTSKTNFALARYNMDGSLDTSFGSGGIRIIDVGGDTELANAFLLTPSGDVYLAGSTGGDTNATFLVAKMSASNGFLDTTYGTNGVATVSVPAGLGGGSSEIASIAIDPTSGNLVAAGLRNTVGTASDFAIARFTTSGALDSTFGTSGFFVTDFAGQSRSDEARGVTVQGDGKIIAVGFSGNALPRAGDSKFAMLRLTNTGALDSTFAAAGKYLSPATGRFEALRAVTVASNGQIIVGGTSGDANAPASEPNAFNADLDVLRFSPTGAVDTSFGTSAGQTLVDLTGNFDEAKSILLLPDGRVIIAGTAGNTSQQGGGADFGVARLSGESTSTIANLFAPAPVAQGTVALFTLTLAQASNTPLTFNYATSNGTGIAGTDYTAVTGSVAFAPGETSKTIAVTTLANAGNVNGANFTLTVTPPTGVTLSNNAGTATILGAAQSIPQPVISINNVTVSEPGPGQQTFATFTVTLDRTSTSVVTVQYKTENASATAGSNDYLDAGGTLTFQPGETSKTVQVLILPDATDEQNESFVINLTNPTNATLGLASQGIATIVNTPATSVALPTLAVSNANVTEPATGQTTFVTFTVTLSAASATDVSVGFATADGTATANLDYTPTNGTLIIAAGQTTGQINVPVLSDAVADGGETFSLNLINPVGAILGTPATGTATVADTAPGSTPIPSISAASPAPITERLSNRSAVAFVVTLSQATTVPVTVNYTTTDGTATGGSDFIATSGILTFAPGETTKTVNVVVNGDTVDEGAETFGLTLSAPTNGTLGATAGTATINNATFTTQAVTGKPKFTFTDAAGKKVTVALSGPGTATLFFPTGTNQNLDTISLDNATTSKTKLTVSVSGKGATTNVASIKAAGTMGTISAATTNLNGDLSGSVGSVTVKSVNGTGIPLNALFSLGGANTPTLSLGPVTDLSISSAIAPKSITVSSWSDTDANDTVTVPSLATYSNKGASAVRISATAGTIKTFSVKGAITAGGATATDTISSVSASSIANAAFTANNLISKISTKGNITNTVIQAANRVASVTGAALTGSKILAGIPSNTAALPTATSAFTNAGASIGKISLKSFSNSLIVAPTVDSATLGTVDANSPSLSGVATDNLKAASYTIPGSKKASAKKLTDAGQSVTSGNFTLRIL